MSMPIAEKASPPADLAGVPLSSANAEAAGTIVITSAAVSSSASPFLIIFIFSPPEYMDSYENP